MKTFRKILIIATSYYFIVLLTGCLCKCDKPKYKTYSCEALQLNGLNYKFPTDTTFELHPFESDTVSALEYGLGLNFEIAKYANLDHKHYFSIVNQANACKCAEPGLTPQDIISEIKIQTLYAFDTTYPQGSDVSDLFASLQTEYNPLRIVRNPISSLFKKTEYYSIREFGNLFFSIYLDARPSTPKYVQFKVVVNFTNGKSLTATSESVYIK